jgi:hypothetical protein
MLDVSEEVVELARALNVSLALPYKAITGKTQPGRGFQRRENPKLVKWVVLRVANSVTP